MVAVARCVVPGKQQKECDDGMGVRDGVVPIDPWLRTGDGCSSLGDVFSVSHSQDVKLKS